MLTNPIVRFFAWVWRLLNNLRRVLHLVLLLAIFSVLLAGAGTTTVMVPESAALVVDPTGALVEQLAGDPLDRALEEFAGEWPTEALLQDVVDSLEAAAEDDRIKAVVLRLEYMTADSLPKLRAVAGAIGRVREAGKKVITLGDAFDQDQYYLAAHGDEIYMNDLGFVYIDGYGYYRTFFRSALEKLHIDLNVFRVGEFKSFVEPYIRDDMSDEDKTASRKWLELLWASYQRDVVKVRGLDEGSLLAYANNLPELLAAAQGSTSRVAVDAKLVDGLMSRQEFSDYMTDMVGPDDEGEGDSFAQIDYLSYLGATRRAKLPDAAGDAVAVVVAAGQIVDGDASPGMVGGDTLAETIRQAGIDDSVRAVVLRIDSPGGSMFASEVVADALDALKETGKPLVASMGGLAASGGYYIALPADEIWTDEATITGSIGVGAIVPTINRGLDKLGVHVDGFGTTDLAGQLRLDRELGPDARNILQQGVADAYRIFVAKVAAARKMEFEETDALARGRVWIGSDALELGLVDSMGGLDDAIDAAARRAGLESGSYETRVVEPELSMVERLLRDYGVRLLVNLRSWGLARKVSAQSIAESMVERGSAELERLAAFNDPRGLYMLCACDTRALGR
ncbi:MAG: signal peptide peptidase SppA [Gammaproteobacteria bacterium]|nr:signal peptide peptidase SppA [Gammaproteobacteria bacterium]